jgi:protein kinase-like protein
MVEGDGTLSETEATPTPASPPAGPGGAEELPRTTLIDRYQIERRLGAGAMGVVYAARDMHLGREVAVKLVGPRVDPGAGDGRLVREAQAMARLRHPNLATVYDIGVSRDRLFVVMELVDGGTVADWLKAKPRSWREIVAVYLQAARGLVAAHAAGFVHLDFKPDNVLVGKDGVARVSDFGVARILGEVGHVASAAGVADGEGVTRTGGVVGTPGYIAPELLRNEPVDVRADQFSFCVALYASLHGERPFERLEGPDRIAETLGQLRPARTGIVPGWLQRILTRGLAADPRDRWPTIDALIAAIERRLRRRVRAQVLTGVGVAAVAAAALLVVTRVAPAPAPDWSPVVIARESSDSRFDISVSPDGSTLAIWSANEAWVEPRTGGGARRHVAFPFPGKSMWCRLSRTGDRLLCSFEMGLDGYEIWALDVATGQAERRVPPIGAPTLKPGFAFDIGSDGSILFSVVGFSAVWRLDPTGAVAPVVTAGLGQRVIGAVWSPDGAQVAFKVRSPEGARIEVMNTRTRAVQVVSHRHCAELEWLTESSLVCVPATFRSPVVVELLLSGGGHEAEERVRYRGPELQALTQLAVSSAGVVFSTTPNDQHLGLVALDAPGHARRIVSGGITDLPAAGWTSSGLLVFGASVRGQLRIMALRPDGGIDTVRTGPAAEVPLVVLGDTIVFGRFPGGESTIPFFEAPVGRRYPDGELFRLVLTGGAPEPLGRTSGFHALLCAGGRATPCLLAERSGGDAIAIDWDPETGARGRQRARWRMGSYPGVSALSPDGRTLAQVSRYSGRYGELSLLDLESGARRRIQAPAWRSLDFPTWQPDGTLLALGARGEGETGIVRVGGGENIEMIAVVPSRDEPTTDVEELQVSPDGKTAAVLTTDSLQTHWWVPRSRD